MKNLTPDLAAIPVMQVGTSEEIARLRQLEAAAPELLAALEKIAAAAETGAPFHRIGPGYFEEILDIARAAIAKAKGE